MEEVKYGEERGSGGREGQRQRRQGEGMELRLAAPVFCGPVADLINLTLMTSTVPTQWKCKVS